MIYGFSEDSPYYDVVLTLYRNNHSTYAYGFNSKIALVRADYQRLFDCVYQAISTPYLMFETLLPIAKLFRVVFHGLSYQIEEEKPSRTFDGYDSITFKIRMKT